ncbi:MAG: hypothetical protein Q4G59_07660, partial [Planctomycetia bacterium]|nr:hypothetical protein [Planctomycetia bacterium]
FCPEQFFLFLIFKSLNFGVRSNSGCVLGIEKVILTHISPRYAIKLYHQRESNLGIAERKTDKNRFLPLY